VTKKIVSFTLSKESIEKIEKTSKILGMSKSELVEFLVSEHFRLTKEVMETLDQIEKLQKDAQEKLKARNAEIEK
jgi:hypothetical protein